MRKDHVHLTFLLDCSGSMCGGAWEQAMEGYKLFLEEQKYSVGAYVTVDGYSFDDYLHEGFVGVDIHKAPKDLPMHEGGTAIGESLVKVVKSLNARFRSKGYESKEGPGMIILVLITDGGDGWYGNTAGNLKLIENFQNAHTKIISFSPGDLSYDGYGIDPALQFHLSRNMKATIKKASDKVKQLRIGA